MGPAMVLTVWLIATPGEAHGPEAYVGGDVREDVHNAQEDRDDVGQARQDALEDVALRSSRT